MSNFARHVFRLAGSTAASQALWISASPILTRLYSPADFGVLGTITAILAILNIVSSFRYELAIPSTADEAEAIELVWLSCILVMLTACLALVILLLFGSSICGFFRLPTLSSLPWIMFCGVLLPGLYQVANFWAVRKKNFDVLAKTKLWQSFFGISTNILFAPLGAIGLISGHIVGQASGMLRLFVQTLPIPKPGAFTLSKLLHTAQKNQRFAIFSLPAGLINIIGTQFPSLIFVHTYGLEHLGMLALSQRLLLLPASLIGNAVAQVLLADAAARHRRGELISTVKHLRQRLLYLGLGIGIMASLFSIYLFESVFGSQWSAAVWVTPTLCPLMIAQLAVSPLSMSFVAAGKNRDGLSAQIMLTATRLLPLLLCTSLLQVSFPVAVAVYSSASAVGYFIYSDMLTRALTRSRPSVR